MLTALLIVLAGCFSADPSTPSTHDVPILTWGEPVVLDCPETPLTVVPDGPTTGIAATGTFHVVDHAGYSIRVQAWDPSYRTEHIDSLPPDQRTDPSTLGWAPRTCAPDHRYADIRPPTSVAELGAGMTILLGVSPTTLDEALIRSVESLQQMRRAYTFRWVAHPDHASSLADLISRRPSHATSPTVYLSADIPLEGGVFTHDGDTLRHWGDLLTTKADAQEILAAVEPPPDDHLGLDDLLDFEQLDAGPRAFSHLYVACRGMALEGTEGRRRAYIQLGADLVEDRKLLDVAFWEQWVWSGQPEVTNANQLDCFLESAEDYVVMRWAEDGGITYNRTRWGDSEDLALDAIGKFAETHNLRAIWVGNRTPPAWGSHRPRFERRLGAPILDPKTLFLVVY